jgi:hypothetical protein
MSRLTDLRMPLLAKLGSLAVHIEEVLEETGLGGAHPFDVAAIKTCLDDPELKKWIAEMSAAGLVPQKRKLP